MVDSAPHDLVRINIVADDEGAELGDRLLEWAPGDLVVRASYWNEIKRFFKIVRQDAKFVIAHYRVLPDDYPHPNPVPVFDISVQENQRRKPIGFLRPLHPSDPRNPGHPCHQEQWRDLAEVIGRSMAAGLWNRLHRLHPNSQQERNE